ncbi:hypothetical protein L2E82_07617 [Cichorium intybus]|uniref:Uncharacterized protein n=1 Tax=Cichorium intybus TaxID=13427 RepID=A0ACB9G5N3_CICIN|nr:hypothetical protein L2E82_07617 [Cichorium intybus]
MVMNIILYLCILFPIFRVKYELLNLITGFVFYLLRYDHDTPYPSLVDLPVIRFEDLNYRRNRSVEEMCFICSADYRPDDVVCQLSRCHHVFHSDCVGQLLHQKQPSCPFCRSPIFSGLSPMACKNF